MLELSVTRHSFSIKAHLFLFPLINCVCCVKGNNRKKYYTRYAINYNRINQRIRTRNDVKLNSKLDIHVNYKQISKQFFNKFLNIFRIFREFIKSAITPNYSHWFIAGFSLLLHGRVVMMEWILWTSNSVEQYACLPFYPLTSNSMRQNLR